MILRANIRGNGEQLTDYLLTLSDNSHIEILEVDGRENASPEYLRQTLMGMQFNGELTKSDKSFFNIQMNPAYGEDKSMTRQAWYLAADILAKNTEFENQRRVIILHTKKGRTHAHLIFERYNHETGKMIDNKFSRLKVDAARPMIEAALGHKQTPRRNPNRDGIKVAVTRLWNATSTGPEFIKATRKAGYMVATGTGSRPYMIVDETGRAFDLVRQIEGVRTKDVRARLRHEPLVTDKRAIEIMRELQSSGSGKRERQQMTHRPSAQIIATGFADNRNDATVSSETDILAGNRDQAFNAFKIAADDMAAPPIPQGDQRKQDIARQFAENDLSGKTPAEKPDAELQKILAEQERARQRNRQRKPHR